MAYRYALLRPVRAPGAEAHNRPILMTPCLGIEVTEPELAARCVLGNIDPQHIGGTANISAIEAVLAMPLPPRGAVLVTIRPDADAYGAMAVITLRASGHDLSAEQLERIAVIGRADRHDRGRWSGPSIMPRVVSEVDEVGPGPQGVGALHAGLARPETSVERGVKLVTAWILTGLAPAELIERANRAAGSLFDALVSRAVTVRPSLHPSIALVEGFAPGALRLGYRVAPIVIAIGATSGRSRAGVGRKISIAQYDGSWSDLPAMARELSIDEPGWGGSATIVGSPQGVDCTTSIARCREALLNFGLQALMASGARGDQ